MTIQVATAALGMAVTIAAASGAYAMDMSNVPDLSDPGASQAQTAMTLVTDGVTAKPEGDPSCPAVVLAPDGATFPNGADDYKATVEGLARDCANLGAETILKIAVVGEGQRDGKNGPSWFNAPLRLSVKDADGNAVETRKVKVKVEMPEGVQKVSFNHVEEDFSLPAADGGYAKWTIVVGFDPVAAAAASQPSPSRAVRAAAVKRATRAARVAPDRQQRLTRVAIPPANPVTAPSQPSLENPWQRVARGYNERRDRVQQAEQARQEALARPVQPVQQQTPARQARPVAPQRSAAAPVQPAARSAQTPIRTAERN